MEDRSLSPDVIAQSIQSEAWPSSGNLVALGDLTMQRAEEAHLSGRDTEAEQSLQLLADFAERAGWTGENQKDLNGLILQTIRQKSLVELGGLYESSGRSAQKILVDVEIASLKKSEMERQSSRAQDFESMIHPFLRKGFFVQISALAILFFASVSVISLFFLELRAVLPARTPRTRIYLRSFVADYGPWLLLTACVSLLVAYHPFEQAFVQFRSEPVPTFSEGQFMLLLFSLRMTSPTDLGAGNTYLLWWVITLGLSALALFILFRPLWKRRAAA